MCRVYFLIPKFDNHKSFYNKAMVYVNATILNDGQEVRTDGETHLISYGTDVCYIKDNKVHLLPYWNYSATTLRHVKEFLKQNGFTADSLKQMTNDYCNY